MDNKWVGKRFRARCLMHLPDQGEKRPGEEFVFTDVCARYGLQPESWLAIGNAELVGKVTPKPTPAPKPPDEPKPDDKPKRAADVAKVTPPSAAKASKKGGD